MLKGKLFGGLLSKDNKVQPVTTDGDAEDPFSKSLNDFDAERNSKKSGKGKGGDNGEAARVLSKQLSRQGSDMSCASMGSQASFASSSFVRSESQLSVGSDKSCLSDAPSRAGGHRNRRGKRTKRKATSITQMTGKFVKPKYVILEDDNKYKIWWTITLLAAVATGFMEPIAVAFGPLPRAAPYANAFDITRLICIPIFAVDSIVQFFVAFTDPHSGELITSLPDIRKHYLMGRFWVDLVAWFPFDKVVEVAMPHASDTMDLYLNCLRLLCLLRMYRLLQFFSKFDYNTSLNQTVLVLTRNTSYILVFTHWAACVFYWIARVEAFRPQSWVGRQWDRFKDESMIVQYIYALYWSITAFASVGDQALYPGATVAEASFMICYVLFNIALSAYILGTMTMLVVKGDKKTKVYRDRVKQLTHYSVVNSIPDNLQASMQDHLDLNFRHEEVSDEQVLNLYPTTLRKKVLRHLYQERLQKCFLFQNTRTRFLDAILSVARMELIMPSTAIVVENDHVNELYIVMQGEVEVIRRTLAPDNGKDVVGGIKKAVAGLSATFGEVAFFTEMASNCQVNSVGVVRCLVLTRNQYDTISSNHPMDCKNLLQNLVAHQENTLVEELRDAVVAEQLNGDPDSLLLEKFGEDCSMEALERVVHNKELKDLSSKQRKLIEELMYVRSIVQQYVRRVEAQRVDEFLRAATRGDVDTVKKMLLQGHNKDSRDSDGRTAIMLASAKGNTEVVRLLLDSGADTSVRDIMGSSAMFEACKRGFKDVVDLLIEYKAPMNVSEVIMAPELCNCVLESNLKQLSMLLKGGSDPNASDYDKRAPLHIAAADGNLPAVRVLIEEGKANPHILDRWSNSPMDEARRIACEPVIDYLLPLISSEQNEASIIKWQDTITQEFLATCSRNDLDKLLNLLKKGCPPDTCDHNKRTGLMVAANAGFTEAVKLLLAWGANANHKDVSGSSAMLEACKASHEGVVDTLVQFGYKLDMPLIDMAALMCTCVFEQNTKLLKLLLSAGARPEVGDYDARNALHIAACEGFLDLIKLMLEASDCEIDSKDRWGATPLSEARRCKHQAVVEYLESISNDPSLLMKARAAYKAAAAEEAAARRQRMMEEAAELRAKKEEEEEAAKAKAKEETDAKARALKRVSSAASMDSQNLDGLEDMIEAEHIPGFTPEDAEDAEQLLQLEDENGDLLHPLPGSIPNFDKASRISGDGGSGQLSARNNAPLVSALKLSGAPGSGQVGGFDSQRSGLARQSSAGTGGIPISAVDYGGFRGPSSGQTNPELAAILAADGVLRPGFGALATHGSLQLGSGPISLGVNTFTRQSDQSGGNTGMVPMSGPISSSMFTKSSLMSNSGLPKEKKKKGVKFGGEMGPGNTSMLQRQISPDSAYQADGGNGVPLSVSGVDATGTILTSCEITPSEGGMSSLARSSHADVSIGPTISGSPRDVSEEGSPDNSGSPRGDTGGVQDLEAGSRSVSLGAAVAGGTSGAGVPNANLWPSFARDSAKSNQGIIVARSRSSQEGIPTLDTIQDNPSAPSTEVLGVPRPGEASEPTLRLPTFSELTSAALDGVEDFLAGGGISFSAPRAPSPSTAVAQPSLAVAGRTSPSFLAPPAPAAVALSPVGSRSASPVPIAEAALPRQGSLLRPGSFQRPGSGAQPSPPVGPHPLARTGSSTGPGSQQGLMQARLSTSPRPGSQQGSGLQRSLSPSMHSILQAEIVGRSGTPLSGSSSRRASGTPIILPQDAKGNLDLEAAAAMVGVQEVPEEPEVHEQVNQLLKEVPGLDSETEPV